MKTAAIASPTSGRGRTEVTNHAPFCLFPLLVQELCELNYFLGEPGTTGGGQSQRTGGDKVKLSFLVRKACKIFGLRSGQGHRTFHIDVKPFCSSN
jgi:hypothetical protein